MKKYFTLCAVAIAAIACQKQDALVSPELIDVDLQIGVPTKTAIDANGGMTWKSFDELSVFSDTDVADGQTNYLFTVKELSADSESAVFNGSVCSNEQRTAVYAFYPYNAKYTGTKLTGVTISYDITDSWLYPRLLMAGKGSVAGNDFDNASVEMKQLTWLWDITIENTSDMAITSVALQGADKIFPYIGDLDLSAKEIAVDPSTYQYRQTLTYMFSLPKAGEDVVARFPIFPMEANGDADLDVIVTFEDGTKEVFSRKAPAKATEAGKRYHNTYTIGEGEYDHMPKGYVLVRRGEDLRSKINNSTASEVKLYLESSPTEAIAYSLGSGRINPTKSIYIKSNPEHVKPVINGGAGCSFEITAADLTGLTFSFKNVEFNNTSNGDFLQISNNGVSINLFEIDNCVFRGYRHSLVRTGGNNVPSGVSFTGATISNIKINNSIFRMNAVTDEGKALLYFQKQEDNIGSVSVTNSTFEKTLYLLVNNMVSASGTVDVDIHKNTFVNTTGKISNGRTYFVRFANGVRGTIDITNNLFGGSNNVTPIGLLAKNLVTASYSNNFATSDWKSTFTNYEETTDFLEVTSANADVFTDLANFDLTLKSGTTAYGNNVGDPRWLSGSSAGLGDLEIEDTEY
ncbi:MAG: DUF5123 domain-containing protein [Bacteroidales bacterium]|nr:DUF5123 domain-containing protein [Bacteroidales bacterium]